MSSDPNSWKEYKAKVAPGPIWAHTRGYVVAEAGRHESAEQYRAFQFYMNSGGNRTITATAEFTGHGVMTLSGWHKKYNWERRAAAFDKQQLTLAFKEANKIERNKHRDAIKEFREANEEQAKLMMGVSSDLMNIIQKRIAKAEAEGEDIPMGLVSGLMRAAANISDSGRQAWATSLGVNELMQVVETELEEARQELEEVDVYEIPLDED
jgi:hypothetical protein